MDAVGLAYSQFGDLVPAKYSGRPDVQSIARGDQTRLGKDDSVDLGEQHEYPASEQNPTKPRIGKPNHAKRDRRPDGRRAGVPPRIRMESGIVRRTL